MTNYIAALAINTLRLPVHLGLSEGEREKPQAVDVDIRFYYEALPECATDDEHDQFICYDSICNQLTEYVRGKEFRFLEYLTMDIHRVVRLHLDEQMGEQAAQKVKVWTCVHKCNAPVPYMLGGAKFVFSDLPINAAAVEVE